MSWKIPGWMLPHPTPDGGMIAAIAGDTASAAPSKPKQFTIRIYDDEQRLVESFEHCTRVSASGYQVQFNDELGLLQAFCGFSYRISQEVEL